MGSGKRPIRPDRVFVDTTGTNPSGSPDREVQTFIGPGPDFGQSSPNFLRIATGEYAYAIDGQIDQGTGTHRHSFAAADAQRFTQPSTGTASYTGSLTGTVDRYDQAGSISQPFVANGTVGVLFGQATSDNVGGTFYIDPNQSNGMSGYIAAIGGLNGRSGFTGSATSEIDVPGFSRSYPTGTTQGQLGGPNAQEMVGVVELSGHGPGRAGTAVVGSWLAIDPSR